MQQLKEAAQTDISKFPRFGKTDLMNNTLYSLILKLTDPDPRNRPSTENVVHEFNQMLSKFPSINTITNSKPKNVEYINAPYSDDLKYSAKSKDV
jgi:hypothetical protein